MMIQNLLLQHLLTRKLLFLSYILLIGADREVFYVQLGGFDTVSNKHNTMLFLYSNHFSMD